MSWHNRPEHPHQSKTISTTPSMQQLTLPIIHSYHRYDTLLHYFNSFMTDFKLHIVELKELVYWMVGVHVGGGWEDECWADRDCQFCEVEFLMRACRVASQDIRRVLGLLRGYSRDKPHTYHPSPKLTQIPTSTHNASNSQNICPNQIAKQHKLIQPQISNHLQTPQSDTMGFLTFRQNEQNILHSQFDNFLPVSFKNIDNNFQSPNRINLCMPVIEEQYWEKSSQKQSEQTDEDSDEYFERAYQLINLIKNQVTPSTKNKNQNKVTQFSSEMESDHDYNKLR